MVKAFVALATVALSLNSGCRADAGVLTDGEQLAIAQAVDSATRAFEAAERARDVEGLVAHLAPDFHMYQDGVRVGYDSTVAMIRGTMGTLQSFEPGFADLEVMVLGRNGAAVSFTFHDMIVTADDDTLRAEGPTTLVWVRRGSYWLIRYADADHYPALPASHE
jgi:ketosteroid isomerase-like protein